MTRHLPLLAMALGLSACTAIPDTQKPATNASVARPSHLPPQTGLEAVIGRTAPEAVRMFGEPRQTVNEPPAQKLQFSGRACVLDLYLYPGGAGNQLRVAHVDARNAAGAEVDRIACVNALRRN